MSQCYLQFSQQVWMLRQAGARLLSSSVTIVFFNTIKTEGDVCLNHNNILNSGFLHYAQRVPLYFKAMTCLYSSLKVADQSRVGFVWTRDRTVGRRVPPHEVFFQWGNMALMSNIWFQSEIWGLLKTKIWASQKSVNIQSTVLTVYLQLLLVCLV